MQEIWKNVPIEPYSEFFMVSNLGNIKMIKKCSIHRRFDGNETIIEPNIGSWGYKVIRLTALNQSKDFLVHRLVAMTFIENPLNKKQVNHIDGSKLNNCVDNLEWVTPSENIQHAYDTGLISYYDKDHHLRPVYQFDLDGNFIKKWSYITEASRALNINYTSISSCCSNKRHSAGGYLWSFYEKCNPKPLKITPKHTNGVNQYNLDGDFIMHYESIKSATMITHTKSKGIVECCSGRQKTSNGFKWEYA